MQPDYIEQQVNRLKGGQEVGPDERLASDKCGQIGNDEGTPLRSLATTAGREARPLGLSDIAK